MSTKEALYEKFEDIPSRRGRGGTYSYVRWQDVADRMNTVFNSNWSSRVEFQEVINGNVIVRVSVSIVDDEGRVHTQEGFGGAPLDDNNEAGNPFKSAYSKALKDACKKWGVGLYLEEDGGEVVSNSGMSNLGGKEYGVPNGNVVMPSKTFQSPNMTPMSNTGGYMPAPNSEKTMPKVYSTPPMNTKTTPMPTKQYKPVGGGGSSSMSSTVAMGGMTMPEGTAMGHSQTMQAMPTQNPQTRNLKEDMPMSKVPSINIDTNYISIVQRAALESILNIDGVKYQSLAREAFDLNGLADVPVPDPDKLTYQQAVYVVKHGNDKFRNR